MIHFLESGKPELTELFFQAAELEPISGARLQMLFNMFKLSYRDVCFWVQVNGLGQPVAAISRYGGQLSVCDSLQADAYELEEFVRFTGDGSAISCSPSLAAQLSDIGRTTFVYGMAYRDSALLEDDFSAIDESPSVPALYDLMCEVDADFEASTNRGAWYTHTSHLVRHKLGFCAGIWEDDELISCGGVYASGKTHSVIGGLCTLPEHRGQGHAGLICRNLMNRILKTKKIPAIYAASESLSVYYGSMGFKERGRWAEIQVRP
ncbi:GNAT family N-acetyltransferase, partial [Ruminococcaceae bacterium OttesenSCG-928-L11]|nr:GNAT family N-acetyltransferase [Ruminococcaceae bacterium OttesenSCG-928-L11]